jgi:hypothetical protein
VVNEFDRDNASPIELKVLRSVRAHIYANFNLLSETIKEINKITESRTKSTASKLIQ